MRTQSFVYRGFIVKFVGDSKSYEIYENGEVIHTVKTRKLATKWIDDERRLRNENERGV